MKSRFGVILLPIFILVTLIVSSTPLIAATSEIFYDDDEADSSWVHLGTERIFVVKYTLPSGCPSATITGLKFYKKYVHNNDAELKVIISS